MPVKPDFDPNNLYFITTTAVERAHVFRRDVTKRILADSLSYMRGERWIRLYAFVIMPNHIHLVVRFLGDHKLSDVVRDFKRYTAQQIIRQYQAEGNQRALAFLERAARRRRQRHKVWEDDYDARDLFSRDFMRQKVTYLHNNPCQSHWGLAHCPEAYAWSSARYYLLGQPAVIEVDDIGEWL